jgi:hypothetical protein
MQEKGESVVVNFVSGQLVSKTISLLGVYCCHSWGPLGLGRNPVKPYQSISHVNVL